MSNKLLFLFFHNKDDYPVADVLNQTISVLRKKGHEIIYLDLYQCVPFRECFRGFFGGNNKQFGIIRRNDSIHFVPLLLPFIPRWHSGYILSIAVNIIFLQIYIFLSYPKSHKIIWVSYLYPSYFISFFHRSYTVLYDVFDYITSPDEKTEIMFQNQERCLLSRADAIFCISHVLKNRLRRFTAKPITIVPQGFLTPQKLSLGGFDELKIVENLKKPRIGFCGSINERLDEHILTPLIQSNPQWHFIFLGPIDHEPHVIKKDMESIILRLQSFANVTFISRLSRDKAYRIINEFDIAMIPYDISIDFNRYCYPMKLFEYFYMGKPVIATPIVELRRFPNYVKIGRTPNEWEKHIQILLAKPWPKQYQKEERRLAMANSWRKKISQILKLIQ